jgi:putative DNA primase/helicase
MEYLIKIGLEGLKRVLKNQKFTKSDRVEKELREYEESNNPILGFFKEITMEEVENEPTRDIYKRYQVYCLENNLQALSNIEFSKQVKAKFGFDIVDRKINGKKYRVFQKRSD